MTVIALASAKGSPGVTTSALALAATWPGAVVVVEADPSGGDIRAGYGRGALPPAPGLLELATTARRDLTDNDLLAHSLPLDGDGQVRLVSGVTGPAQLATVAPALPAIAAALRETERTTTPHDVLVDVGRLDATTVPWALLPGCDLVVLVARPTLRQVRQLRTRLGTLREKLDHDGPQPGLGLLLIGDVPYSAGEVAAAVGLPVLAVLADDPAAARVLSDGEAPNRSFARSALLRSARQAAQSLSETTTPVAALADPERPVVLWSLA